MSIDPLAAKYPWYSPYAFSGNKVIWARELEGLEEWLTNEGATAYGPYSPEGAEEEGLIPSGSLYNLNEVTIFGNRGYERSPLNIGGAFPLTTPVQPPPGPRIVHVNPNPGSNPGAMSLLRFLRIGGLLTLFMSPNSLGKGSTLDGEELMERDKELYPEIFKEPEPDDDDREITLYRGVYNGHPDYQNALQGRAVPKGLLDGHSDPERHTGGDFNSIFTSWSESRAVANHHANKGGVPGVVLIKTFKASEVIPGGNFFGELEMLVPGVVTGANVEPPSGPGSPSAFDDY